MFFFVSCHGRQADGAAQLIAILLKQTHTQINPNFQLRKIQRKSINENKIKQTNKAKKKVAHKLLQCYLIRNILLKTFDHLQK